MKKILKLFICFVLFFMFSFNAQAKTINHFHGVMDENAEMSDNVKGSTLVAGSNASMDGESEGVSFMGANKVVFEGNSEYGVFAGNSIEVNGIVNKDTFIAGNIIKIKDKANLKRDVVIAGADIELNGKVGRNISIYASSVSLKGSTIEGNVKISANTVNIDKDTIINGDLYYPSDAEVNIDKKSVKGEIIKTDAINENDDSFVTLMMGKFWSFMSLILIFAVISLAASKIFTNIQDEYSKFDFNKGLETFTKGLLFVILVPIIIFILFLMSIGIPLALILLAFYFIIMYLSVIFTGYLIGYKLWQRFFNNDINMLVVGIFGLAILFVLNLIPGINFIVSLLSLIIGIGIIYDVIIKKIGSNE